MQRAEAITLLEMHAESVRALGATSLYLLGSAAKDQTGPNSDLDLFVEYDPEGRFDAFDLVGITLFLEERPGLDVDVTTRDSLHPLLRERIERTAIRIF